MIVWVVVSYDAKDNESDVIGVYIVHKHAMDVLMQCQRNNPDMEFSLHKQTVVEI